MWERVTRGLPGPQGVRRLRNGTGLELVGSVKKVVLVIPCFNEEQRLDEPGVSVLFEGQDVGLLFVNDGSTDGTAQLLHRYCEKHPAAQMMSFHRNLGKAEAVRHGLRRALADGAHIVGYFDADLATPPGEFLRMLEILRADDHLKVVMASRVRRLGTAIQRDVSRHYLGRAFATAASVILRLPVYDTQCGAKLFRDTPALRHSLRSPFGTRWAFDIHLLARLLSAPEPLDESELMEFPLHSWSDISGSRMGLRSMIRAGVELAVAAPRLRARAKKT